MARILHGSSLRSRLLSGALLRSSSLSSIHGDPLPMPMPFGTLAYEEVKPSEAPYTSTALVLHGLLGSSRNWRSFARKLTSQLHKSSSVDVWRLVLVDLRNHGRSAGIEGLDPPHNMANAARDLANLVKSLGWPWPDAVIGHSMGGKVALEFAASCAGGDYGVHALSTKQLWVLDSVPGELDINDSEVERVLRAMQSLPPSLPSRKWVVDHMLGLGFSKLLSEWIGISLKKAGDHLTWAFDLQAAIEMFNSYRERSYWSLLEDPPAGLEIAIVRAENSDMWSEHAIQRLNSISREGEKQVKGKISSYVLPMSGHWVHVDNPKGLLEIVASNFISQD